MISISSFRALALGFANVNEQPHFEKQSFRVNKKIFATLDKKHNKATLKLPEADQSVYCSYNKLIFYPATGSWGKQGWTIVELKKVPASMLKEALEKAYNHVISKK